VAEALFDIRAQSRFKRLAGIGKNLLDAGGRCVHFAGWSSREALDSEGLALDGTMGRSCQDLVADAGRFIFQRIATLANGELPLKGAFLFLLALRAIAGRTGCAAAGALTLQNGAWGRRQSVRRGLGLSAQSRLHDRKASSTLARSLTSKNVELQRELAPPWN
jgi:hypothetical protein